MCQPLKSAAPTAMKGLYLCVYVVCSVCVLFVWYDMFMGVSECVCVLCVQREREGVHVCRVCMHLSVYDYMYVLNICIR